MINATDVRIGNLIFRNPQLLNPATTLTATPVEVASISAGKIGYFSPTIEHRSEPFEDDVLQTETPLGPLEEFEPIPLNADVLDKFSDQTISINEGYRLFLEPGAVYLEDGQKQTMLEMVKYLHQLQNLYFDLTGHELDIRL